LAYSYKRSDSSDTIYTICSLIIYTFYSLTVYTVYTVYSLPPGRNAQSEMEERVNKTRNTCNYHHSDPFRPPLPPPSPTPLDLARYSHPRRDMDRRERH